ADVTSDLQADMVTQQEEHEARDPAVAVSERVNTQEVEIEGAQGYERMDRPLRPNILPAADEFAHESRRVRGRHRAEADRVPAIGKHLDDVVFLLFILAGIADAGVRQEVQFANRVLRDRQLSSSSMD